MKSVSLVFFLAIMSCVSLYAQENESAFFPKIIENDKGKIVIYQPQSESLKGDVLESRVAISVKPKEDSAPTFGVMWVTSYLEVDRVDRLVTLKSAKINAVRFPEEVDSVKIQKLKSFIENEVPNWHYEFSLDGLISTLEEADGERNVEFKNEAPKLIFRTTPAVLIMLDGEPKLQDLEKKYQRIVNTPVFMLKKKETYYLYGGGKWFKTKDLLKGPWSKMKNPPTSLTSIEKKYNKTTESQETTPEESDKQEADLEIIVATTPTELIVTEGEMNFVPIANSGLMYVENTMSDLFMDVATQQYYLLISGRWFTSTSIDGAWTYLDANDIPEDFKSIPEDSAKGDVLASVPGTYAAKEAVLDANIPQTAAIDRKNATASVTYDGDPIFKAIDGTTLSYAVNTSSAVFLSKGVYFLCDNAVWFSSPTATGPWTVSDIRPVDIDKVPSGNPNYNVKYVYIYESTPEVVYVGYTPGYIGCYAYGPTVVYGTGWYYPGWYGMYYYPRPVTYGFAVHYSTYAGWSIGFGVHVGYGGWYGGRGWYGPPYYRPPHYMPPHHRPPSQRPPGHRPPAGGNRPPATTGQRPNSRLNAGNLYNHRKDVVSGNHQRPSTRPATRPSTGGQPGNVRPATRDRQTQPATRPASSGNGRINNDVYSDRNGNVYRRSSDGWQQRESNHQWSAPTQRPSNGQMNNSYQNRQRGAQRSQSFQRPAGGMGMGGRGGRR
ncbi:carbohydrate-binding family V/XII [Reichenbachiella sp. 5M10]|uniref:carbohydrate-binding family V/XII n=1 Tax=Reichenbachiella sp. 5M10 TaxID=1889772 RepID=UPI00117A14F4|nr:carbohydrate-binding family V/XII [Reichenbachiella sp. 5M10]